jgi:hypothetical protein
LSFFTVNAYNLRSVVSDLLATSKRYSMTTSRDYMMSTWCLWRFLLYASRLVLSHSSAFHCRMHAWNGNMRPRCGPEGSRRWSWWGYQPHTPAAVTPRKCSWYSSSLGAESTPGPGGNMSLKNPVTLPGIDPGTVRLVAQRLNHYATVFRIIFFTIHVGHPPGVSYFLFLKRSIKRPVVTKNWSRSQLFYFHNVCRLLYFMGLSFWLRCTRHTMYILLLAASSDYRIYLS